MDTLQFHDSALAQNQHAVDCDVGRLECNEKRCGKKAPNR